MINFSQIQSIVCKGEKLFSSSLQTKSRKREIVFARQLVMFFLKQYTKESLGKIGEYYGQSHCNTLHAIKAINNLYDSDKNIRAKIIMYEFKFDAIKDFENNIIFDKIEEIKELLKVQVDSGYPISMESVIVYNKLLEKNEHGI